MKHKGFTLIEIAIVMFIIALLSSAGIQMLTGMVMNGQRSAVRSSMDVIKSEIAFKAFNGRSCAVAPCTGTQYTYTFPAPATNQVPCAVDPISCPTGLTSVVTKPTLATIGIASTVTTDPWGRPINYNSLTASIDSAAPSGSVVFTLVSAGPDGIFGNQDDFTLAVTVAEVRAMFMRLS